MDEAIPTKDQLASDLRAEIESLLSALDAANAILRDPQKWMKWCDVRVLEENESLRTELDASQQENDRLTEKMFEDARQYAVEFESFENTRAQLANARAENERLLRGEYICSKCGLRTNSKDVSAEPGF